MACHQAAAVSVQETMSPTEIKIKGYRPSSYFCPSRGQDGTSGGTALYVKEGIPHRSLSLNTNLQAVAVKITVGKPFTLCSIYMPWCEPFSQTDLNRLLDQLPSPYILMGDFNSHSPLWGSPVTNPRGKIIEKLVSDSNLFIFNDGSPTYFHAPSNTFTHLDLSLAHPSLSNDFSWSVANDLHGSDHFPTLLTSEVVKKESHPKHWNFAKADWDTYNDLCTSELNNTNIANIEQFQDTLLEIAEEVIPKTSTLPRKDKPWFNNQCRLAIQAREAAFKELNKNPTYANLIRFKQERAKTRRTIREQKRLSWRGYISKINTKTPLRKVWKMIKKIKGKDASSGRYHLKNPDGTRAEDEKTIANTLGQRFSSNSSSQNYSQNFRNHKERSERKTPNFSTRIDLSYNSPFSLEELTSAIQASGDTAPGLDGIHNKLLKHLPSISLTCLLSLLNGIWTSGSFPDQWRQAKVIPIPKPKRDLSDPSNYRPIALTSCLCKLMERMVTNRLNWFLESNNILSPYQCGFRTKRSTNDHLVRLESFVRESFIANQHLVAIFFDLEKAFETTWKHGILQNLHDLGLRGHLPTFIQNFLQHRSFQVQVGSCISEAFEQEQGVPQGSILSPALFNIQINSITETLRPSADCSLYVDDFVVCYRGASMPTIERQLQLQLNSIQKWADTNGFKFSPEKTAAVHFCNKKKKHADPDLYLNGNRKIPVQDQAKFLGVLFDKKLSFIPQLKQVKQNAMSAMNVLKSISGTEWGADKDSMLRLYRSLVRSRLDYGSIVYGSARPSYLKMLDPVHHQGLRLCLGAYRTSPVESLYVAADEPSLQDRREKLSLQYCLNLRSHPDNPAFETVFHPALVEKFESSPNVIPPLGMRVKELFTEAKIDLSSIEEDPSPEIPPWLLRKPEINLELSELKKAETSAETYINNYEALKNKYSDHEHVFTDGSKDEDAVGAAAHSSFGDSCCGLNPEASIFTAESKAIEMALDRIASSHHSKFVIFSDSLSCLLALRGLNLKIQSTIRILQKLNTLSDQGKKVSFCWIPSHIGIDGNENVDELAKVGLELTPTTMIIPASDYKSSVNRYVKNKWQQRWNDQTENKLHAIQPQVGPWSGSHQERRRDQIVLDRLRLGHSHLTHSFLPRGEDAPECIPCNTPLTVAHVLVECPEFNPFRGSFKPFSMRDAFENYSPYAILAYLKRIGLYSKI
ncbi:MAG: endonuclease/exonuclease/phosphatase family protein [Candidatus Omnitrophica bacterium]|nr:endonuclease/exonuclease/phosphatase family protein [Candidatus Omnitrophota bacterium]